MDAKYINVLLIEDNLTDTALIREMLNEVQKPRFKLHNTRRLEDGLNYIEKNEADVLLLDLNLPDSFGFDTFLKAKERAPQIPIVILSAFDDEDVAINAVKGEAQDYLIKGKVDSSLLSRSMSYAIERKAIEGELIRHRDHLEELVQERTIELQEANKNLKKEIEERKMAEDEIKASLEEKNILLEEIHHRVENNLQTISNLMGLEYTQLNDKEPIEIYQESQNRVKAIALIHETLSRSEDFAIIDFGKYAHDLINHLFKSYAVDKNIDANIKMDGILLDIDTAVPCGLILNELVTNSIKHAFPSSYFEDRKLLKGRFTQPSNREFVNDQFTGQNDITGEINIFFTLDDGNFTLKVGDNGIGLPADIDFRYAETSGMQLVNALVRQLDGLIDLEKDNGCEFKIIFRESSV
ncbi:histidine kinase dimerization/phosphoacceptor domain -containing protein [Methanobacterium sp. MBAC-LM]|uniref:sensor histidine kinase n=1 Tax=Methanobacterium sp. MBAC-LM TaxID=3412034 RepID=UPI003C777D41